MTPEEQGAEAWKNRVVVGDCPFDPNGEDFWQWLKGWTDAAIKEKGLVIV
jgi:hypothetical protein